MAEIKKILLIFGVFTSLFSFSQDSHQELKNLSDSILKKDTMIHRGSMFKEEKGGAVCVNGLEKLELAMASDKSIIFVNQLHFYALWILEGRTFIQAKEEKENKKTLRFFEGTFDLTVKEFPLHLGYTMGMDQLGKNPNVNYSGLSATVYLSDISKIHRYFHILRTGVSYVSLSENIPYEDSTRYIGKKLEYSGFFQLQPLHITHDLSIFSEGLYRIREKNSFGEIEIGLKHEKVFKSLMGIGIRAGWEDSKFHSVAGVVRFNISNPNPKHLKK